MNISKGLAVKGTAATAVVASTTAGAIYKDNVVNFLTTGSFSLVSEEDAKRNNSLGFPWNQKWPTEEEKILESNLTVDQLRKINFDGKGDNDLKISGTGTVTLHTEKVSGSDFPQGFKFILKTNDETGITVGKDNTTLFAVKKGMNLEFKIKGESNDKWSLERVWDKTKLGEKINLTCPKSGGSSNECSFKGSTNIFESSDKKLTGISITTGKGKIKFKENQAGYNQGLKLTVEEDDIKISGNTGGITKLDRYASYEIKEQNHDSGKLWFLSRKNSPVQEINEKISFLGLPNDCKFDESKNDTSKECTFADESSFKKINFSNKGEGDLTVEGTVSGTKLEIKRIERATGGNDEEFSPGLRFTFKDFTTNLKIKGNSNDIVLKKDTNPEFKINDSGKLEKAWTTTSLAKEASLKCPSDNKNNNKCSFSSGFKVYEGNAKSNQMTIKSDSSVKNLDFTEDVEGYNQGLKLMVSGGNMTLNETSDSNNLKILNSGSCYEVKYFSGDWCLNKKTSC